MKRIVLLTCIAFAVCALAVPASSAAGRGGFGKGKGILQRPNSNQPSQDSGPGDSEAVVLPPVVRKAAEAEASGGKIVDAERTMEDGEAVYDVTYRHGLLVERSATFALDGTLLSRQVFWRLLPAAVKQTIASFERHGQIGEIYMSFEDGDVNYAVEVKQVEGKRFFTVALDGTHEATQMHMAEIPETVQRAIRAQALGGNVFHIDRSEVDGGRVFNVLMIKDGKRRTVSIDVDGAVTGMQVFLPEIPAQCQMSITKRAGGARIAYIERSVEDGQLVFDVITINDGRKREFVVGKDGNLLSTVVPLAEVPEAVKSAIRNNTTGGRIVRVDKLAEEPGYEVEVERNGKKRTVSVSANGKLE